jgi:hypothetical protein
MARKTAKRGLFGGKSRTQRVKSRQRKRTQRQRTRQRQRTARVRARQATKQARIGAKERSGAYTPAGMAARGQVATGVIGAATSAAAPLLGLLGGEGAGAAIGEAYGDFQPAMGGGSFGEVAIEEGPSRPAWLIPAAIGGGALLLFLLRPKKGKK